jgi:UDP-N-acetylmuramoyl-L-alanyl-D-glutamate--2,6-diaminopimelate ligase
MPKSLSQLFIDFPLPRPASIPDVPITGIVLDSRKVQPGNLFVAMRGGTVDGHAFIPHAIKHGAAAVVGEENISNLPVPYIKLESARHALTYLAAAFHDWPGRKLIVVGITGTDGKTTTTNLIYEIMKTAGFRAGMVSTVNAVIGEEVLDTGFHVTTPDAHDVQDYLARMVEAGSTHVVLETTSHGWAQHRVDACEFDVGIVTNITHEHLDEHGSYENYRAAKARLFESLEKTHSKPQGNPRLAVINHDDQSFDFLQDFIGTRKINYGLQAPADVYAEDIRYSPSGVKFRTVSRDFRVDISSSLLGAYNISNCLAALTSAVYGLGVSPETAARGIASLPGIPGRMERIDMGQSFMAIVDFAHTPNALKVTLETARIMLHDQSMKNGKSSGRIIVVFGSAGLRDRDKRRMMAETAAEKADISILTAEDPRTESLDEILSEMALGAVSKGGKEGETFWRVRDRGDAIRLAVKSARQGDIVLACGKGHEQSMCFGAVEYPWDDRIAMQAALAELLGVPGPEMPYLPSRDKMESEWLKG